MSVLALETLVVRFVTDLTRFETGLARAEQSFINTTNRINMVAAAFGAGLAYVVGKASSDFDEIMTNTFSTMENGSAEARLAMENTALALSAGRITGPVELARGYEELAKAGHSAAQMMAEISVFEQFSVAGRMSTTEAVKSLLNLQRGLQFTSDDIMVNTLNLQHMGDVITAVANRSNVSARTLTEGLAHMSGTLRYTNTSLYEGAGILALFASQGRTAGESAKEAENLIKNFQILFARSQGPAADRREAHQGFAVPPHAVHPAHMINGPGPNVTGAWRELGVELYEVENGPMRSMTTILGELQTRLAHLSPEERMATMVNRLGFARQTIQPFLDILGRGEDLAAFVATAKDADGMMRQIYNTMSMSFNNQFKILRNNVNVVAIEIGRILIPYLIGLNAILLQLFGTWHQLPNAAKVGIAGLLATVGALLFLRAVVPQIIGMIMYLGRVLYYISGTPIILYLLSITKYIMLLPFNMAVAGFNAVWYVITWLIGSLLTLIQLIGVTRRIFTLFSTLTSAVGSFFGAVSVGTPVLTAFLNMLLAIASLPPITVVLTGAVVPAIAAAAPTLHTAATTANTVATVANFSAIESLAGAYILETEVASMATLTEGLLSTARVNALGSILAETSAETARVTTLGILSAETFALVEETVPLTTVTEASTFATVAMSTGQATQAATTAAIALETYALIDNQAILIAETYNLANAGVALNAEQLARIPGIQALTQSELALAGATGVLDLGYLRYLINIATVTNAEAIQTIGTYALVAATYDLVAIDAAKATTTAAVVSETFALIDNMGVLISETLALSAAGITLNVNQSALLAELLMLSQAEMSILISEGFMIEEHLALLAVLAPLETAIYGLEVAMFSQAGAEAALIGETNVLNPSLAALTFGTYALETGLMSNSIALTENAAITSSLIAETFALLDAEIPLSTLQLAMVATVQALTAAEHERAVNLGLVTVSGAICEAGVASLTGEQIANLAATNASGAAIISYLSGLSALSVAQMESAIAITLDNAAKAAAVATEAAATAGRTALIGETFALVNAQAPLTAQHLASISTLTSLSAAELNAMVTSGILSVANAQQLATLINLSAVQVAQMATTDAASLANVTYLASVGLLDASQMSLLATSGALTGAEIALSQATLQLTAAETARISEMIALTTSMLSLTSAQVGQLFSSGALTAANINHLMSIGLLTEAQLTYIPIAALQQAVIDANTLSVMGNIGAMLSWIGTKYMDVMVSYMQWKVLQLLIVAIFGWQAGVAIAIIWTASWIVQLIAWSLGMNTASMSSMIYSTALMVLAWITGINVIALQAYFVSMIQYIAGTLAGKVATWLLNIALKVFNVLATYAAIITGLFIIVLVALVIVVAVATALILVLAYALMILAAAFVAIGIAVLSGVMVVGLFAIIAGIDWVIQRMGLFNQTWDSARAAAIVFFWNVIGAFYNFRENVQAIGAWFVAFWNQVLNVDTATIFQTLFQNMTYNFVITVQALQTTFNLLLYGMFKGWTGVIGAMDGVWRNWSRMLFLNPFRNSTFRMPRLELNYDVPPDVKARIEALIARTVNTVTGNNDQSAGAKVGDTFKEMSERRFILDTGITSKPDVQRVTDPETQRILENIRLALLGRPPLPVLAN